MRIREGKSSGSGSKGSEQPLDVGVGSPKKRDLRPVANFGTRVGGEPGKTVEHVVLSRKLCKLWAA